MNDISEMLTVQVLGLAEFHAVVRQGGRPAKINLEVTLEEWGAVHEPFNAYYGLVDGATLASWYSEYGGRLFDDNLRKALGLTPVNASLLQTLRAEPERFWYYNNGVTALCDSVAKTPRGGNARSSGDFAIAGLSIVNGAQTVSSLAARAKDESPDLEPVKVWMRLISLDKCPDGFATEVTRATNTQNTVAARDFLSLDPVQLRLQDDLRLSLDKIYVFKRGEPQPDPADGCTVSEAIVALACGHADSNLAVLAKSAVGRLETPSGSFYPQLFNSATSAYRLWQSVVLYRETEAVLNTLRASSTGKRKAVALQGNRMITHLVMQKVQGSNDLNSQVEPDAWAEVMTEVPKSVEAILDEVKEHIEAKYASNYVTSLFKNASKCQEIAKTLLA